GHRYSSRHRLEAKTPGLNPERIGRSRLQHAWTDHRQIHLLGMDLGVRLLNFLEDVLTQLDKIITSDQSVLVCTSELVLEVGFHMGSFIEDPPAVRVGAV